MKRIGVFFGGKSVEHDISVITALQTIKLNYGKFDFIPIYVMPNGCMVSGGILFDAKTYLNFDENAKDLKEVLLPSAKGEIWLFKKNKVKEKIKLDCALLCNHGHGGEDGSLQGMLEIAEIPYSSCDVSSSAMCMDKVLTKMILFENHIPSPTYVQLKACEYKQDKTNLICQIIKEIGLPCIVKPVSLGSSVGISICEDENMLQSLIETAFVYDEKVLVEPYLTNAREFCCAVIKSGQKLISSKIVEVNKGKMFSFDEKYLSATLADPQKEISLQLQSQIQDYAKNAYKALSCFGVVRVDFLLDSKGELFVNEVNSIPGSLSFNLFDFPFDDLLANLIDEAINRFNQKKKIVYKFNSQAISKYIEMTGKLKINK